MARRPKANNQKYYSEKYLISFVGTKSMNKLRNYIDHETKRYPIAAYLYFNFEDSHFREDDPLKVVRKEFAKYHKLETKEKNRYFEVNGWINALCNKNAFTDETKQEYVERINKILFEKNLSFKRFTDELDISYQNTYRVIVKNEINKISVDKLRGIYREAKIRYGREL